MKSQISKLEERAVATTQTKIWVDWTDRRARLDVNDRRGKERTFSSVFEAKGWIEGQISKAARVRGTAFISDISQLFEDKELQAAFGAAWGDAARPGVLISLATWRGEDLAALALSNFIFMRFSTTGFYQRWLAKATTPEDERVLDALFLLYAFLCPGTDEAMRAGFAFLVYVIAKLPPVEVEGEERTEDEHCIPERSGG